MCRRASCLWPRERSPRRPAKLVLFPPPTLSLGRLRRAGARRIASTERSWRIPRAMRRDARAGNMSLDGPGAVLSKARRSPITFPMRPVPLAGAGSSLICTLSSDEISTLAICWSVGVTSPLHSRYSLPAIPLHGLPQSRFKVYLGFVAEMFFRPRDIRQRMLDVAAALCGVDGRAGVRSE